MATFQDKAGRKWEVELDFDLADEVLAATELDLIDARKFDSTFGVLAYGDPRKLRDVLWLVVRAQAETAKVSREDFSRALGAAQLQPALDALKEAIADFSPRPELADAKRAAFRAMEEIGTRDMPTQARERLAKAVAESGGSPGGAPESLGESPTSGQ